MSTSAFQNASQFSTRDVNIDNSQINNYFNADNPRDPLELLLKHTTKEATHESVTYSYAPTCHPGTRKIIKIDIMDFIKGSAKPDSLRLAWLSGPAGAGKSCIQRTVVEECLAEDIPACSFFFGRDSGLDSAHGFVATIAHQLCNIVPRFREAIIKRIPFDPSIFKKALILQTHRLVLDPLRDVYKDQKLGWTQPMVVIVDGLDECRDSAQRLQVIYLLQILTQHPTFPFCVIVSSRPEFDILTAFAGETYGSVTRKFLLHDYDAEEDMLAYLVEEFSRIRRTHPARRRLMKNWPTQQIVELLVKMATGQFILLSTVIRYIENGTDAPDRLLNKVIKVASARMAPPDISDNPFVELDALYTEILQSQSPNVNMSQLRLVLHAIPEIWRIVETNSLLAESIDLELGPSPSMLDAFFGLTITDTVLSNLYALLHVPGNSMKNREDEYIRFYHKSMEDYLRTPGRSGDLFQTEADTIIRFTIASIQNLERWSLSLEYPFQDKAAAFGALYLCIRFGWDSLPTHDFSTSRLEHFTDAELAKVLDFDATILLGWIFLYGRSLWPNPNDMLNHMRPQSSPLDGLRDRWLQPIAEGVKILHTCEVSIIALLEVDYHPKHPPTAAEVVQVQEKMPTDV
ncbi:hypothetical protein EST38_g8952 [Candolleomyces aberdarensis]|uniref:Nephrocystin 3-like N-terminal domain-containing protein n=1 Tax=Candolleomyces aberdarensis TaxID=2316362 RepID=A0A4Q2DC00_9AGAR|nr:hypothetical protein EST38_g8952 [Candolleomyces aberdarensis]